MKLFVMTCASLLITVCIIAFSSDDVASFQSNTEVRSTPEHQRPADQTFLTYPEWFLVFSPEEFAEFSKSDTPDDFPFFGHIGQFWQAYGNIYSLISKKYPFNTGYHVMIMVIGGSTTVEYSLRECYEKVIGRLSKLTASKSLTDEDRYAANVAQEYVDFIKVLPWYEFNFEEKLRLLWREPMTGENMVRKWERRYILTTDYGAKALYGWLIKKMTKASYEDPLPVTSVVLDQPMHSGVTNVELLKIYADSSSLILVPRYDAFKDYATLLVRKGMSFKEIAGNSDVILITCRMSSNDTLTTDAQVLFRQPILTQPGIQRVAFVVPISEMHTFINSVDASQIQLEHIYDF